MAVPVLGRLHPWAAAHRLVVVASAVLVAAAAVLAVVLASSSATADSAPSVPPPTHAVPYPVQTITPDTVAPSPATDACSGIGRQRPC